MPSELDAIVARLQNMHPFNIYSVEPTGDTAPWFDVDGTIMHDVVIKEEFLREQVQSVSGQIMHWGRMAAQTKRVWEMAERDYRIWRDTKKLSLIDPTDKPEGWKKVAATTADLMIRSMPEYATHYTAQERAEEAYNSAMAIYDAFKAKKEVLKFAIRRRHENAAPTLDI